MLRYVIYLIVLCIVAVVCFGLGIRSETENTRILLRWQLNEFHSRMMNYVIGDGDAAQVCIPVRMFDRLVNSWRENAAQAERTA